MVKIKQENRALVYIGVAILVVVIFLVAVAVAGSTNKANNENKDLETVELNDELVGAQLDENLAQEEAEFLRTTDVSGLPADEQVQHYLLLADTLITSENYDAAITSLQLATQARPDDSSLYIAQAEAYILAEDADSAKAAYRAALEAYQRSGEDGADQFAEYIETQISGVDLAIEAGIGPIFDGRTQDDNIEVLPEAPSE